ERRRFKRQESRLHREAVAGPGLSEPEPSGRRREAAPLAVRESDAVRFQGAGGYRPGASPVVDQARRSAQVARSAAERTPSHQPGGHHVDRQAAAAVANARLSPVSVRTEPWAQVSRARASLSEPL